MKSCVTAGQLVRPDLHLRAVDLVLLPRLPELVHPAKGIARCEDLGRKPFDQFFKPHAMLARKPNSGHRVVRPEHLRQHPLGETRSQGPAIHSLALGKFLALVERDGHCQLRLDQQVVLRQETGEQHGVPLFVGALLRQVIDPMRAGPSIHPVA